MTSSLTASEALVDCPNCGFKHTYKKEDGFPTLCPRCGTVQQELVSAGTQSRIDQLKAELAALEGTKAGA